MKPLTLYDYLRVGHVKRWHNVNTVRQQTVAEHSYMVALIAIALFQTMVGIDPEERDSSRKSAFLIMAWALFHDMPEVVAGDIPTPAKRFLREFTGRPDLYHEIDAVLMPELPFFGGKCPQEYERFINMADKIEATHWISDNGAGRHAEIVIATNWRNVEDLVEKYDQEEPTAGWYAAVNRVLTDLGMRFVHEQSRITRT